VDIPIIFISNKKSLLKEKTVKRLNFLFSMLFILSGFFILNAQAHAADHPLMTSEELEVQARARKKIYPGGRDEEPLKVQEQLPQAVRKMGPATEASHGEESADD
jgi:hypothetical protein